MRQIVFFFDVASPLAWLAFEHLPQALVGISHWVDYRPLSRGAFLERASDFMQQAADAELRNELIVAQPLAGALNVLLVPPRAGFDSRPLQALAVACAPPGGGPNRFVVERLMHHVWRGGQDPLNPKRFAALLAAVAPRRAFDAPDVRAELSAASLSARASGVNRIPTFVVPSLARQFDAVDALPELARALVAAR